MKQILLLAAFLLVVGTAKAQTNYTGTTIGTSFSGTHTGTASGLSGLDMTNLNMTNYSSYGSGTAYTMTASAAQAAFGTASPQITISQAGTYLITGGGNVKYSGATYAGTQTATIKFRRTNNTAADLANATRTITLRIITTVTDDAGYVTVPPVIYTATAGDIVQLWGSVSATPAAGSVVVDSGEITAVRVQ